MELLKQISLNDLPDLAKGATLLGSGGGGDPTSDCLYLESLMQDGEPLELKQVSACDDNDMVVLVAGIGAPLVSTERLFSGDEFAQAIRLMEQAIGRPIENVAAGEIGGANAFAGLLAAKTARKTLIDGDVLGRAFPTLNISSCALHSLSPSPAVIVDCLGHAVTIHTESPDVLERYARSLSEAMGSSAACALYPMNGRLAKQVLLSGTVSESIHIGQMLRKASGKTFVRELSSLRPCRLLGKGVITKIEQEIAGGFLLGKIVIEGEQTFTIEFQNEFLAVFTEGLPLATTPDIITLLANASEPLGSDQVRHGLEVEIIAVACPPIWKSPAGLRLTSPAAFGYTFAPVLLGESL